jgi:hypothetical protein
MENHKEAERYWNKRLREYLKYSVPVDSAHIRRVYTPREFAEIAEQVIREESENVERTETAGV